MPRFFQDGSRIIAFSNQDVVILDSIEPGIYRVGESKHGMYIESKPVLPAHGESYGRINSDVDMIINTYKDRDASTGVAVVGSMGTGKSRMTNILMHKFVETFNKSVLIVDSPVNLQNLTRFINLLDDNLMVVMDEFEKKYRNTYVKHDGGDDADSRPSQTDLLTLFDGHDAPKNKCLFVIISNSKYEISEFLMGRPGRIYYFLKYGNLSASDIREYCKRNNVSDDITNNLIDIQKIGGDISFDSMKAIVDECQRYNKLPSDVIDNLNVFTGSYESKYCDITVFDTIEKDYGHCYPDFNLLSLYKGDKVRIHVRFDQKPGEMRLIRFNKDDIVSFNDDGSILLKCEDGRYEVSISKQSEVNISDIIKNAI